MLHPARIAVEGISPDAPLRVLYIVGCGRSGSTIVDTILGNQPGVESVGEARHIAANAWLRTDSYCACGTPAGDCSYWNEVQQRWIERVGEINLVRYAALVDSIEPSLKLAHLERQLLAGDEPHIAYLRSTANLLAAIRDVSGAQVIVDSSKNAARALALSMVEGVDLRLIHMVRDCRGVAWSKRKSFRKDERAGISANDRGKNLARSVMVWNVANYASTRLRRSLPRENSIRLRYEDFVIGPEIELQRIGRLLAMDLKPLASAVRAGRPMEVGHTVAGNRLRMEGSVCLRPDVEWIEKLAWQEKAVCWAVGSWFMRAYGYPYRPCLPRGEVRRQVA